MKLTDRPLLLVGVIAVGGLVAACGASSPSATPRTIEVSAKEFAFTPSEITIDAGEVVTIAVTNNGTVEHDMTITAADFILLAHVGETATAQLGPLGAGTYEITCSVLGHEDAGMTATLTVK